jgi:tetraacyldisaccharide 4'-kinase
MRFDQSHYWYGSTYSLLTYFLLPVAWLFQLGVLIRQKLYRYGWKTTYRFPVPIMVVGNITVGGTGKTPCVIWLANFLSAQGYSPGIVSRGVGGKKWRTPQWVYADDSPDAVGDEAILIARNTRCPMVISVDRVAAVRTLLAQTSCDVVICDDGLQHYRLGRDIEIALLDGTRGLGNRCFLPAGPLRESPQRLKSVDFVVINGNENDLVHFTQENSLDLKGLFSMQLEPRYCVFADFPHKQVHAVAGIGHPERFFRQLEASGFDISRHAFTDHYLYQAKDIDFPDLSPIVMTEKDAVKCFAFAPPDCWFVALNTIVSEGLQKKIVDQLMGASYDRK